MRRKEHTVPLLIAALLALSMLAGCTRMEPAEIPSAPAEDASSGYTVPADLDVESWELALANQNHLIASDYQPELANIGETLQIDARIKEAYDQMTAAAEEAGYPLYACSAYRSYQRQQTLFNNDVDVRVAQGMNRADAEQETAKNIALPGASDHQLGLGIDLVSNDWFFSHEDLEESFEETQTFAWLDAHAQEYGFILRYPKDKTAITKVNYEPWHYRYVGVENAKKIKELGLCLEEYVGKAQ